jgi:anti-sigma B factor antagonist
MRSLTIRQRQVRGAVIVDLEGGITLGETNRKLHEAIKLIVDDKKQEVILNLAKVTKIDSSGLGEIVAAHATIKAIRGSLKLVNLPENVADLMMMTKLLTVFDVYDDESTALDSFEKDRERVTAEIPAQGAGTITREFPENFGYDATAGRSVQ